MVKMFSFYTSCYNSKMQQISTTNSFPALAGQPSLQQKLTDLFIYSLWVSYFSNYSFLFCNDITLGEFAHRYCLLTLYSLISHSIFPSVSQAFM